MDEPRRGLAEKRDAIVGAARAVFGRDGYTRASIDVIAKEAGVSTRTIYNHFRGKEQLFLSVIEESSARVRDAQIEIMNRMLADVTDVESDLTAFARVWVSPLEDFADHYALIRQLTAEARHFPSSIIETWLRTGPTAVRAELGRRLRGLADRGLLTIGDEELAAAHFASLVSTEIANRSVWGAVELDPQTVDGLIVSGVRTFLYGHLPRS